MFNLLAKIVPKSSPYVEYFRNEFPHEYNRMKKQGLPITEELVKSVVENINKQRSQFKH